MFTKATKSKAKLRLAISAPSGAGKTYSALRIANGIGGKIALIDTERHSASKYADRFDFDVCDLESHTIQNYVEAINSADGYDVLIIDSLSHAWQELLQEVERLAKAKYRGNTWSAWSEGTPMQKALVNAILGFKGHVIATMRCKTEWSTEQTSNGKSRPVKIGLAPEQGKGIEYEFDMMIEISPEHFATITKDRTGKYQDQVIEKPSEDFGKELSAWLDDGIDMVAHYCDQLNKCKSMEDLQAQWLRTPKQYMSDCADTKDAVKDRLTNRPANSDPEVPELQEKTA